MLSRFALFILVLLGLIYSPNSFADPRSRNFKAELVVVLNKDPSNLFGGEIWLIRLDGRLVRRITKNNYHEEHPRFSPDGTRIAFVRNTGGLVAGVGLDRRRNEIFIYDLRTGTETRLTKNSVEDGHPEWSYDGSNVLFFSRREHPENRATLWIMASDGSHPSQITPLLSGDLSHTDPVWAPGGTWLAFVNQLEKSGMRFSRIEKIRVDGTQRTVVSSGGKFLGLSGKRKGELLGDVDPTFSPDGAMIWSARHLGGGRLHLFAYGAGDYYGGKAEIDMSWTVHPDAVERTPKFSPDGRRLVLTRSFLKAGNRTHQLVLTDPQSSFRRHLTSRMSWDVWDPSWYPFALSGADREAESTVVAYESGYPLVPETPSVNKERNGGLHAQGLSTEDRLNFLLSKIQGNDPKRVQQASTRIGWKLETAPDKLISLALRFKGRLKGLKGESVPFQFQLMDWKEKNWVTVFAHSQDSGGKTKVFHEIAPGNFVNRVTRQLLLRIIPAGVPLATGKKQEPEYLRLEVRIK